MSILEIALAALVIGVPLVALVGAVYVGCFRSGYNAPACWAAYEQRRAAGEVLAVMEPDPEPVS